MGKYLLYLVKGEQALRRRRRVAGGHQDVEVAHSLPSPPVGARDDRPPYPARSTQVSDERLRDRLDRRERDALLWFPPVFELVQELLLGLLAEPVTAVDATRPERLSQLIKAGYPKLVVQRLGAFRADSRQLDQVRQPSGHTRARLLERRETTRPDHADELLRKVVADARQFGQVLSLRDQPGQAVR